jgi:hypothetical protein
MNRMKTFRRIFLLILTGCILSSCATGRSTEEKRIGVREKIPIEIQGGKPLIVTLHTHSPGGVAAVAIRCSPEVWKSLTGGGDDFTVQLVSSRWSATIRRERGDHWATQDYYVLFSLLENYQPFTKIKVRITFPNAPPQVTRVDLNVFRMPTDSL